MAEPDHADNRPGEAPPRSETFNFMHERVRPLLNETFDAYVIMGYVTDDDGTPKRVVAYKDGISNPILRDAIQRPLMIARAWGSGQL